MKLSSMLTFIMLFGLLALCSCGEKEKEEMPTSPQTDQTQTGQNQTGQNQTKPAEEQKPANPVSFAKDVLPILQGRCAVAGCHIPPGASGGLSQNSYDNLMKGGNSGKAIIPRSSANSLLVKRIEGKIQPQMPQGQAPLSKDNINKIKKWIDEGAKNN